MPEVQDIFRQHGEEYLKNHNVPYHLFKTMKVIEHCRTAEIGAHVDYCEGCGNVLHISYNSCRNRHCPKCQALPKERWIEGQKHDLLDVGYFHVVFTIPHTLNDIAFQNQREVYSLLFRAVAETLKELLFLHVYFEVTSSHSAALCYA